MKPLWSGGSVSDVLDVFWEIGGERTLTPDGAGQQDVERRHGLSPRYLQGLLDPLGVLVDHRVDDVHERLVRVEQAVATAENVTLEPAFDGVLGQHLHDTAVGAQVSAVLVFRQVAVDPDLLSGVVDLAELVALRLVRAHDAESLLVVADDRVQELRESAHGRGHGHAGLVDLEPEFAEVLQAQRLAQQAAVRDRVLGHALALRGRQLPQLRNELAFLAEQLLRLVSVHPRLERLELLRVRQDLGQRDLMRAPEALEVVAVVVLARGRPALGRAQDDHGPLGAEGLAGVAGFFLELQNLLHARLHRRRHGLVHALEVVAGHDVRRPAVAAHERDELFLVDASEHCRVVDLVAVQVQDGQHAAVADRVEELVAVPGCCERTRLALAVTDDCEGDGLWVVEDGAEGVRERVAELAALVDAAYYLLPTVVSKLCL